MVVALAAFADGLTRLRHAPALLLGTLAVAGLLAISLGSGVHAGQGLTPPPVVGLTHPADLARTFARHAGGAVAIFAPPHVMPGDAATPAGAARLALHMLVWLFLAGGVMARLARNQPAGPRRFFTACGRHTGRFLRLAVVAAAGYVVLGWPVGIWSVGTAPDPADAGVAIGHGELAWWWVRHGLAAALVMLWTLWLDFAMVRTVIEDRRSALGAVLAGSRFVIRHPMKTGLLWLLQAAGLSLLLAAHASLAVGTTRLPAPDWPGTAAGLAFVAARLFLMLLTWASALSLFQTMQIRAVEDAARSLPVWTEAGGEAPAGEAAASDRPGHAL